MLCNCRSCKKPYEEGKSRADLKGYCTQRCLKAMAKKIGMPKPNQRKPGWPEYDVLKRAGQIGSVPI
jgi:hypothetical protein